VLVCTVLADGEKSGAVTGIKRSLSDQLLGKII